MSINNNMEGKLMMSDENEMYIEKIQQFKTTHYIGEFSLLWSVSPIAINLS